MRLSGALLCARRIEQLARKREGVTLRPLRRGLVLVAVVVLGAACTSAPESAPTTVLATTTTTSATTTVPTATTTTEAVQVALWADATEAAIGFTAAWSNKVELADLDGDGDVDILFADGGDYDMPGGPVVNQVWINDGSAVFEDRSADVLGGTGDLARAIEVRDLSGDGVVDIFIGTTYQTQSRLLLGGGGLAFEEVTATHLPAVPLSVGDVEAGDVDSDGDLDLILADWGAGSPMANEGGRVQLWLNDGTGRFTDATAQQMPDVAVRFSWELEFVDADNDYDLDVVVSCKQCSGSFFFVNDGSGSFEDASDRMPQYGNNYDFEVIDLDGDGFQDLITINDGQNLAEHVFRGDGSGGFVDATADLWPDEANLGGDDNMIVVLDYDSDGDADFLIGSLELADRLLVNDGSGHLTLLDDVVFGGRPTTGTLGIAVADLDGDGRLDVVQAQGEVAEDDRVFLGAGVVPDTAPPVITGVADVAGWLHARIHDNKTPVAGHDFQRVYASGPGGEIDLAWYGEALWRVEVPAPGDYTVCTVDRAGNEACSEPAAMTAP